ncbi:MAG: hypothetical protein WC889_17710 [Myxococcota bacterium]|jgi:hypothetical protein
MRSDLSNRELAYCGLFGAAALMLPFLFHLVRLGHIFMPMYIPLVALAFFVGPVPAAITAFVTPLLSGLLTGMPPFFPPVAVFMAVELAVMCFLISLAMRLRPGTSTLLVLVPVLVAGRALHVAMVFGFSKLVLLPAGFMAGVSLITGWPGLILMVIVIPPVAMTGRKLARKRMELTGGSDGDL